MPVRDPDLLLGTSGPSAGTFTGRDRSGQPSPRLAIVAVGNTLMGDDGAGPEVVARLRRRRGLDCSRVLLHALDGDLLAVSELLPGLERLIFVDAAVDIPPGTIAVRHPGCAGWAASPHQMDLAATLAILERLSNGPRLPEWELWNIGIVPPVALHVGLSSPVQRAVARVVERLEKLIVACT